MSDKKIPRRLFLKGAVGSLGLAALGGCTSFDSAFTNNKRILDKEVLIVGGGAAGLAAAYEFKKSRTPFRLFEANSRIGGRVYSATLKSGHRVDLGAEFFSSSDVTLLGLLKEFGYKPQLWKPERETFVLRNQSLTLSDFKTDLPKFIRAYMDVRQDLFQGQQVYLNYENAPRFERARHYDEMAMGDLFKHLGDKSNRDLAKAFQMQFELKYGTSGEKISSLHFINELILDGSKTYFLPESLGDFMRNLMQRVTGPIPGFFARPQMELVEISEIPLGLELVFKTPRGRESYFSKQVILALPPQQLLKVKGFKELSFERDIIAGLESLSSGGMVKASLVEKEKKSRVQFAPSLSSWGHGEEFDDHTTYQSLDAEILARILPANKSWDSYRDWKKVAFSNGGSSFFMPGKFSQHLGFFQGPLVGGKVFLAGDFTETIKFQTLEGALVSGVRAAREIS